MQPCNWEVAPITCPSFDRLTPEQRANVTASAVEFLWNWTGQVYGLCTVSLRPCRQDCLGGRSTFIGLGPHARSTLGTRGLSCGSCGDRCGCGSTPSLTLPGPVQEIESVVIDGVTLDPSSYRVDSHRYLIRLDGGRWPTCQNMGLETDQPDTWEVTYTKGVPVPEGGKMAAATFACELAKAFTGDTTCALPSRISEVSRQGVSIVLDMFEDIDKGHTGIWSIDSWISSVTKAPARSVVLSPDTRPKGSYTSWRHA